MRYWQSFKSSCLTGIVANEIVDLGSEFYEARNPDGGVLFVKEPDNDEWQLAPGGFRVNFSGLFFDKWYSEEKKWKPDAEPDLTPAIEIMRPLFNTIESGEAGCLGERWCLNTEVIPGREKVLHTDFLNVMGRVQRDFWRGFGVTDTTASGLMKFFENRVGGPENRGYWVDAVNPKGQVIRTLQGDDGYWSPTVQENKMMQGLGGFYLDKLEIVEYNTQTWQDIWTKLLAFHLNANKYSNVNGLINDLNQGYSISNQSGLAVNTTTGHLTFVVGDRGNMVPPFADYAQLHDMDDAGYPVTNAAIVEAYIRSYLEVWEKWRKNRGWEDSQILFIPTDSGSKFYLFDIRKMSPKYLQPTN